MVEFIELPLPPSINRAFTFNPRIHALAHTREATEYLTAAGWMVKGSCIEKNIRSIDSYCTVGLKFYLGRKNADSHNYKKLLFDALQKGGLFTDDRYIMDQTLSVEIDSKNPRVKILLPSSKIKQMLSYQLPSDTT